jgi:hypothetical protein
MATLLDDVWKSKSSTINRILTRYGSPVNKDPLVNKIALIKYYLKSNQLKGVPRNIANHPQFSKITLELGSLEDIKNKILGLIELRPLFNDVNLANLLRSLDEYTRPKSLYIFKDNVLEIHNLDSSLSLKRELKLPQSVNTTPHYYKGRVYFVRQMQEPPCRITFVHICCLDLDNLELSILCEIPDANLVKVVGNFFCYDNEDQPRYFNIETSKDSKLNITLNEDEVFMDSQALYNFVTEFEGHALYKYDTSRVRMESLNPSLSLIMTQAIEFFKVNGSNVYFKNLEIYDPEISKFIGYVEDSESVTVYEYDSKLYVLIDNFNGDSSVRVYQLPPENSGTLKRLDDLMPYGYHISDIQIYGFRLVVVYHEGVNISHFTICDLKNEQKTTLDVSCIAQPSFYTIG